MASPSDSNGGQSLAKGEAVRAFYHMNDHPHGYRYVRLLDGPPEQVPEGRAAVGLSTGWIPATVAEDWTADRLQCGEPRVLVRLHGHFADAYNQDPEPVKGMYWRVKRSHVRPMGSQQPPAELSLLVVRWWDYWNRRNRGSRSHNVANEEMLLDVLEGVGSPHALFGEQGNYEVHSAFIRNASDLMSIGQALAVAMRGKSRAGLYFLWPTQRASVERRMAGAVAERALLELMERMEAAGVRTGWPHPVKLYRELAGKLWVPRLSHERPDLCIPQAVRVDVARWAADPHSAAEEAIAELHRLRTGDGRDPPAEPFRGVAKLGFSWMGEDVRPFTGALELKGVLRPFLDDAEPNVVCLVQERIEDVVCELRFVCCQDLAQGPEAMTKEIVWMKLHPPRHHDETFAMTSHQTMSAQEAVDYAFHGSREALQAAERKARQLSDLWLQWFQQEGHGTPAAVRLDFLVTAAKPRGGRGSPEVGVWTVEVCECGGSLCGLQPQCRTAACINACLAGGGLPPQPLPPLRPAAEAGAAAARGRKTAGHAGGVAGGAAQAVRTLVGGAASRKALAAFVAMLLLLFVRARRRR